MSEDQVQVEATEVTMEDGRTVKFGIKSKVLKSTHIAEDGSSAFVRFDFKNGETRTFDLQHPGLNTIKLMAHGAESKIGDNYAGVDKIEDCVEAVDDMIARLYKGEWRESRKGSGESYAGASVLARAISEVRGLAINTVREWLRTKSAAEKLALRKSAQFAEAIQRLEAASTKQSVDLSGIEDELSQLT